MRGQRQGEGSPPLRRGYKKCGRAGGQRRPPLWRGCMRCGGRADVGIGPYGWVTRGAVRDRVGRPQGSPLRKRYKGCSARQAGDRKGHPYGGFTKGAVGRGMPYTHTYAYTLYTPAKASQSLPPAGGKKNSNHFSPRHVRGEKYLSGCQCGILPLATKLCAQQTANPFGRKFLRNFLPVKKETPGGVSFLL